MHCKDELPLYIIPCTGYYGRNAFHYRSCRSHGIDERRVRKDVECGIFGPLSPPRFEFAALIYFRVVTELGFKLDVEDRMKLYDRIRIAFEERTPPARLTFSAIMDLKLGEVASEIRQKLERFRTWKQKLIEDENILGGEPVFVESRLAVRRIAGMLKSGASPEDVKEDYRYLKDEDIEFARLYAVAYSRVGRPRETSVR